MTPGRTVGRLWAGAVAVLVLAALIVQVLVALRAPATPPSAGVGQLRGAGTADRLLRVVSFFTVQSNILCGIVSAQLARNPVRDGRVWRAVRLAALFGITVTGIVYSTVLARIHEPNGTQETFANTVFHYVVPIMVVLGWLLFGPRPRITRATIWLALIWPLAWFGYTVVHGEASGWFPYPFVDVATHGYGRVLLNALAVTAVLGAVSAVFALGDRFLPAVPDRASRSA